jgi:hypothetical protein
MFPNLKNKIIVDSTNSYVAAQTRCPLGWNQSGPYNGSFICSSNCKGDFSYINANPNGYNYNDNIDYCKSAKLYEGFQNNSDDSQDKRNTNLTNGLPPKIQEFLLTQSSLATTNTEYFHAVSDFRQLSDYPLDKDDDLVGEDTSSNPNNLGQAYIESNNDVICPAGFIFKDNNCKLWNETIAE